MEVSEKIKMDDVLDEEQLRINLRKDFTETFPTLATPENELQLNQNVENMVSFILPFSRNKYFIHMRNRPNDVSLAQHIANIPEGISKFNDWFSNELFDFAKSLFSISNQLIKPDIHLARLMDNRDYDAFIINSKTPETHIERWQSILEPIFQISDKPYFAQAHACMNLGLDNAAISLLHKWIQSAWFEEQSIDKVLDEAKAIVAIRDHNSKAGKKGALTRWDAKGQTEKYAITLWLNGNFKNANQAIDSITDDVIEHGKSIGHTFTTNFQASKTIYKWLRNYIKQNQ